MRSRCGIFPALLDETGDMEGGGPAAGPGENVGDKEQAHAFLSGSPSAGVVHGAHFAHQHDFDLAGQRGLGL